MKKHRRVLLDDKVVFVVTVDKNGRITLPKEIREKLKLVGKDLAVIVNDDQSITLVLVPVNQ